MAKREIIGKMACPECGFPDAEVKPQKNPELAYRWCPECNAQYFPRTVETSVTLLHKVGRFNLRPPPEKSIPPEAEKSIPPEAEKSERAETPSGGALKPQEAKQPPERKPGMAGALELLGVR